MAKAKDRFGNGGANKGGQDGGRGGARGMVRKRAAKPALRKIQIHGSGLSGASTAQKK